MMVQLALVLAAAALFLIPSIPGWHGDPERHSLAVLSAPVAAALLVLYVLATTWGLRRHRQQHRESGAEPQGAWSLPAALGALAVATVVTAFVSETLVHSLTTFAHDAHLSQFFVAIVIVAIVGNAAEHGGAIVVARRGGNLRLASEIAVSSSAQVAVLVTPAVALLSWARAAGAAAQLPPDRAHGPRRRPRSWSALALRDGRVQRWQGAALVAVYALAVVGVLSRRRPLTRTSRACA